MKKNNLRRATPTFGRKYTKEERRERFYELWDNYQERKTYYDISWNKFIPQNTRRRILDLGCGPSAVLHDLWNIYGNNLDLIGVDSEDDYLDLAREEAKKRAVPITFIESDASKMTTTELNGKVDLIFVGHAFFGFGPIAETLKIIHDCLSDDGILIIVDIDLKSWRISPYDEEWDSKIQTMLATYKNKSGNILDPRTIVPALQSANFLPIEYRTVTNWASLNERNDFFFSFEVFFPEEEQDEAFQYIKLITEEAATNNRFGFKDESVIIARKN